MNYLLIKIFNTFNTILQDFDLRFPIKDVTLTIVKNNENIIESLNKLLTDVNSVPVNNTVNDNITGIIINS